MDLLTALLACNLYVRDDALVRAIAESNSHGNVLSVLDASPSADPIGVAHVPDPTTVEDALARVDAVTRQGGRPRLGWMQIPPEWAAAFGRDVRDAFDPCINVSIGTAMMSEFDYECSLDAAGGLPPSRRPQPYATRTVDRARQRCVVHKYGEALAMADFETITMLELHGQRLGRMSSRPDAPILALPPIEASPWGATSIFVAITRSAGADDSH